jgi:pyridoxine 4-dehydrogenase
VVIATKGGWERCGPAQWLHNASPKHLTEAVEGSLKRLRLDRIDVYQLHVPDPAVSYDASMETLAKLREQGKIRHVGLSNVTQEHIERGRKIVPIVSVQNRYSFADREWDYVVKYCEQHGIAFLPWAPLGQNRKALEVLEKVAGNSAQPLCRRGSPGCSSGPRSCCPFRELLPLPMWRRILPRPGLELPDAAFKELSKRHSPPRQLSRL